jgi:hypothetical protein
MRAFNKESRNAGRPLAHFLVLKLARLPTRSLLPSQLCLLSRKSHFLDSSFPDLEILINPFVFRRSSFVIFSTSVSSVVYMP